MAFTKMIILVSNDGRTWHRIACLPRDEPMERCISAARNHVGEWKMSRLIQEAHVGGDWIVAEPIAEFGREQLEQEWSN